MKDEEEESLADLFDDYKNKRKYSKPWEGNNDNEPFESYHSLIMFPNFLLIVAKILNPKNDVITLDDKNLSSVFETLSGEGEEGYSKKFIVALLKARLLLDKYVIKRKQDKWSLQALAPQSGKKNKYYYKGTFDDIDENRQLIMLEAMFHVSAPTQNYKWWLFAILYFLYYRNTEVTAESLIGYLENLARAYMLDRYLSPTPKKPEEVIIDDDGNAKGSIKDAKWSNINIDRTEKRGEEVENFVFNFFDYLLWKKDRNVDFEFAYRTSVEHFYPQHPIGRPPMKFEPLHSFGNLCLISRGMNSKFSNYLPSGKADNFGDSESMKSYSLKLQKMIMFVKREKVWDEDTILEKEQEAKAILSNALSVC